jgi:cytosine/uracil/thiamine/allantoin permease
MSNGTAAHAPSQAIFTIFLGNLIVVIPMILNAHAGTRYGIRFPIFCRASFGTRGANIPALMRAFVGFAISFAVYLLLRTSQARSTS